MKLSTIIKNYRNIYGLSLRAFAERCNCSFQYIDKIEKEKIVSPSLIQLKQIASAMGMSLDTLLRQMDDTVVDVELPQREPVTPINIYTPLSCGTGLFVEDNIISTISVPTSMLPRVKKELFAQYAEGDSMIGKGIEDGDLLIFEKVQCESGDVGCFCIDENMATCKILKVVDMQIILMPANDKYEPIIVDPDKFRCVGKLVLKLEKM